MLQQLLGEHTPRSALDLELTGGSQPPTQGRVGDQAEHLVAEGARAVRVEEEARAARPDEVERAPLAGATTGSDVAAASCRVCPKVSAVPVWTNTSHAA
ncbi:hypothetical protein [Nostocoides sp. F2B08]|uniref:hypothetical protein n=1 Tax=Nostocoides sp. F2B08 TaxID=2653936 RepID=UPI00351A7D48